MWRFEGIGTVTWYVTKFTLNTAISYVNGTIMTRNITMYIKIGLSDVLSLQENKHYLWAISKSSRCISLPSAHWTRADEDLVKALDRKGHTFTYLRNKFPKFSEAKLEEGIFIGPQMWEVIQDLYFHSTWSDIEKATWNALKSVCTNFLGNHKAENCTEIVSGML
jgi:hypothetical protein